MTQELLDRCKWPELPEKYDIALRSAVKYILQNFTVLGIIASGTIIRGNPDPASDLDIYVIQPKAFRQRLQKRFNNVPAEIFINPPKAVEKYFSEEQTARRPITAHMLSTGFVILNLDPVIDKLQKKAGEFLANPPAAPADLTPPRYLAALLYEDAIDVVETDPETAEMILNKAIESMLNFLFIEAGGFIPRQKSLFKELGKLNSAIEKLARQFYRSSTLKEKMGIGSQIAMKTVGVDCFFEWDSSPDEYS